MTADGTPRDPSNPFNLPPLRSIGEHPYNAELEGGREFAVMSFPGPARGGNRYDDEGSLLFALPSGAFNGQTFYEKGSVSPEQGGVPPFLGNIGGIDVWGNGPIKDQINGIYNAFVLREAALGDVDLNGVLDAADIDLLSLKAITGSDDAMFDLTGDGSVDGADRSFLIEDVMAVELGDSDLNGAVDFADFLSLSAHFGGSGGWAGGDFDGNGRVEFPDFLALSSNYQGETGATVSAVPEPASVCLTMFGILGLIGFRRRR
jgi:hypothetical protein